MIFLTQNLENQNHKTMMEAKCDPEKDNSMLGVLVLAKAFRLFGAKNYGRG